MLQDLRFAGRRLLHQPALMVTVVVTLALGIGANTAMFSVIDAVLLRPLPFSDPDTLVEVRSVNQSGSSISSLNFDAFTRWREQTELFSAFEGYSQRAMVLNNASGEPVRTIVVALTGGVMPMLGVTAQLGRGIQAADAQPGLDRVLVLSHALWRNRFGGDPHVVGRTVRLDDGVYEIVGVMPPQFKFPRANTEAWTAAPIVRTQPAVAGGIARPVGFTSIARLAPNVTFDRAQERVAALTPAFAKMLPRGDGWRVGLYRFNDHRANPGPRRALWVLSGALALLLLIACANIANLLLARAATRERELAIRAAIGASRWRLMRELFAESVVLAVIGGAVGTAIALAGTNTLMRLAPRELTFLTLNDATVDPRVLLFAGLATVISAILFSLGPAIRSSRLNLQEPLKANTRTATGTSRQRRTANVVVVAEIALSLALLVAASLLVRTFAHVTSINPGFDTQQLAAFTLELPSWKYTTTAAARQFWSELSERVRAVPGVTGVTITAGVPPSGGGIMFDLRLEAEGNPNIIEDRNLILPLAHVQPDFFDVLGIPLLAGRTFASDDTPQAPQAIIVNEAMSRRLWPGGNAVGGRVRFSAELAGTAGRGQWYSVVGVVGNVYQFDLTKGRDAMAVYFPISQGATGGLTRAQTFVVRTAGDPLARINDIQQVIRSLEPEQAITRVQTIEQAYAEFFSAARFYALLMGVFAGVGLLLAVIGLYGVIAHTTAQRTAEFGIRMALGAQNADVFRLVFRHGTIVTLVGITLGIGGALLAARSLDRLLVGVVPNDPLAFVAVALILSVAAIVACWIPAKRAVQRDPVVALRQE